MRQTEKIFNWVIYMIISPSGKLYIGKTNSNYKNRERYYKTGNCKGQPKLYSSFKKYGYDSHEVKIIDEFESDIKFAGGKEMFWIRSYMSNCCKWSGMRGLNLTDGGEGNIGLKMSPESRKKISDYVRANPIDNKGKKRTPEQIERIREASRLNNPRYWKGKKRSEEDKKKMIENRRANGGYMVSEETRKKKSDIMKGRKRNVWWGYKLRGRKSSPEAVAKMVESKKNSISLLTAEQRKEKFGKHNIGATFNRGRKHTEESKIKMRRSLEKARIAKAAKQLK